MGIGELELIDVGTMIYVHMPLIALYKIYIFYQLSLIYISCKFVMTYFLKLYLIMSYHFKYSLGFWFIGYRVALVS